MAHEVAGPAHRAGTRGLYGRTRCGTLSHARGMVRLDRALRAARAVDGRRGLPAAVMSARAGAGPSATGTRPGRTTRRTRAPTRDAKHTPERLTPSARATHGASAELARQHDVSIVNMRLPGTAWLLACSSPPQQRDVSARYQGPRPHPCSAWYWDARSLATVAPPAVATGSLKALRGDHVPALDVAPPSTGAEIPAPTTITAHRLDPGSPPASTHNVASGTRGATIVSSGENRIDWNATWYSRLDEPEIWRGVC